MMYKFFLVFFVAFAHFNGLEALKCYRGSGSPSSPAELSGVECSEGIINCLKMVSSKEDGSDVSFQYQCGTNAKKENGCMSQDPSQPFNDELDEIMDEEMKELEKDTKEMDEALKSAERGATEGAIKVHSFPPNFKISKTIRKEAPLRDANWSELTEENVERVKRDVDEGHSLHMFCYCDKDLCNGSSSLSGAVSLAGVSLSLVLLLSHF